jgi:hypothetical protein
MASFRRWVTHPEEDLEGLLEKAFRALESLDLGLARDARLG